MSSLKTNKFNVGDKVVRKAGFTMCNLAAPGYGGDTLTIERVRNDGTLKFIEDENPTMYSPEFYDIVEEKPMFDMKKEPWVIYVQSKEEAIAAYEWIKKESGLDFSVHHGYAFDNANYNIGSIGFTNRVNHSRYMGNILRFGDLEGDLGRKVIKLSFKTETKITNVKYPELDLPEIMLEKDKEVENVRKEMEKLAERLKKLEEK